MARDGNRRHVGERQVVKPTHGGATESAAGRLGKVVVLWGLVVNGGDPAVSVGAELILGGCVGVSAGVRRGGLDAADVEGLPGLIELALLQVGGGGGTSTPTVQVPVPLRLRASVAVTVTVIGPAPAPAVSKVAVVPVPLTRPALELYE